MKKDKLINIRLTSAERKAFKKLADDKGKTLSQLILDYLRKLLSK